jgi:hypothetical protein
LNSSILIQDNYPVFVSNTQDQLTYVENSKLLTSGDGTVCELPVPHSGSGCDILIPLTLWTEERSSPLPRARPCSMLKRRHQHLVSEGR